MAYKIVNGKLVLITSQSDFGTPAQKKAGRRQGSFALSPNPVTTHPAT